MQTELQILVESAQGLAAAKVRFGGSKIGWHTHSPYLYEVLKRDGAKVSRLQDGLPSGAPDEIGYAAVRAVKMLEPDLQAVGRELGNVAAMEGTPVTLQRILAGLLYKKALFDVWRSHSSDRQVVVGNTTLTPIQTPDVTIDRFDTLFAVFAARGGANGPEFLDFAGSVDRKALLAEIDRPHWIDRLISLADLSPGQLIFRAIKPLYRGRPINKGGRTRVTVFYPNEIIREMLPELLRVGAQISFHSPRKSKPRTGEIPSALPSAQRIGAVLEESLKGLNYVTAGPVSEIVAERIRDAARFWRDAVEDMDREAERVVTNLAPEIVLSNSIGGFTGSALVAGLQRRNVKIVLAEHGVSAGLTGMHEGIRALAEPRGADAYLVCSENAAQFFRKGGELGATVMAPIGLSKQTRTVPVAKLQRSLVRRRFNVPRNRRFIMYVTTPFQNTMRMIPHSPEDTEIHDVSSTVANRVLPHVDGIPLVKLYATRRHIDPDPLNDAFPPPPSVQVCKTGDFRYMRAAADVIVVDLPLSTLGWAIGTGKPLIFLLLPRWKLLPGVETALESSIFLIRTDRAGWSDQLKDMLNWDGAALKTAWDEKRSAREVFLDQYIFGPKNAGRNGAEFIARFARHDQSSVEQSA